MFTYKFSFLCFLRSHQHVHIVSARFANNWCCAHIHLNAFVCDQWFNSMCFLKYYSNEKCSNGFIELKYFTRFGSIYTLANYSPAAGSSNGFALDVDCRACKSAYDWYLHNVYHKLAKMPSMPCYRDSNEYACWEFFVLWRPICGTSNVRLVPCMHAPDRKRLPCSVGTSMFQLLCHRNRQPLYLRHSVLSMALTSVSYRMDNLLVDPHVESMHHKDNCQLLISLHLKLIENPLIKLSHWNFVAFNETS